MKPAQVTHLFADDGAVCGDSEHGWRSLIHSMVTCPECRAVMDHGPDDRGSPLRRALEALRRVAGLAPAARA